MSWMNLPYKPATMDVIGTGRAFTLHLDELGKISRKYYGDYAYSEDIEKAIASQLSQAFIFLIHDCIHFDHPLYHYSEITRFLLEDINEKREQVNLPLIDSTSVDHLQSYLTENISLILHPYFSKPNLLNQLKNSRIYVVDHVRSPYSYLIEEYKVEERNSYI